MAWHCSASFSELILTMAAEQGIEDSEMKLAVLTLLARMLEIKSAELEGGEGTGPLERDQQILEAARDPEGQPAPVLHEAACLCVPYRTCMGQDAMVCQSSYNEQGHALITVHLQQCQMQKPALMSMTAPALNWCMRDVGRTTLPARLHSTILYRTGQKQLARQYLQLARSAVVAEMDRMRALIAEEEAAE